VGLVEIYLALADQLAVDARARGEDPPIARHPSLVGASLADVPRQTLLGLEDDEEFVTNCYLILLRRPPRPDEVERRVRRLREGIVTREQVLDKIVGGATLRELGLTVNFT
jgi:hypothetical protein